MSPDSIQALVSLEESVTHHHDDISLTATQQPKLDDLSEMFMSALTCYIDDLYSTGDSDVKLNISRNEIPPRLGSTSIATVGFIQK
jgi:hypothetical protein